MASIVRGFGLATSGLPWDKPPPNPNMGYSIDAWDIGPKNLKWFGSSWASKYMIFRRDSDATFSKNVWKLITSAVMDNVQFGKVYFELM